MLRVSGDCNSLWRFVLLPASLLSHLRRHEVRNKHGIHIIEVTVTSLILLLSVRALHRYWLLLNSWYKLTTHGIRALLGMEHVLTQPLFADRSLLVSSACAGTSGIDGRCLHSLE